MTRCPDCSGCDEGSLALPELSKEIGRDRGREVERLPERPGQIGAIVNSFGKSEPRPTFSNGTTAIESARACKQGRGFGVVADEVGKLASGVLE